MGDPRRQKKKFIRPKRARDAVRIASEAKLLERYGLKNKKEIYKAETRVKNLRARVKSLITASQEKQLEFLKKLHEQGLIKEKSIEAVLDLKLENFLDRRLQTVVARKFNIKPRHARQIIVHGKVKVDERRVNVPSYFVNPEAEKNILTEMKK